MQSRGAYYNEFDPKAAAWLRELIKAGVVAPGDVDERSIADVRAADLVGYTQHHFFAGIGGWSLALRLAGWPDDRPVWTGSCPCQSFSAAGKQAGFADPRHLWPVWFRLIRELRPDVVAGEQVEAAVRHGWLDLVSGDLEGEGYAVGASVLGAHSVGAPHLRQRLYWVADRLAQPGRARGAGWTADRSGRSDAAAARQCAPVGVGGAARHMGLALGPGLEGLAGHGDDGHESGRLRAHAAGPAPAPGESRDVAQPLLPGRPEGWAESSHGSNAGRGEAHGEPGASGEVCPAPPYRSVAWVACRDDKWRPVESAPLGVADGLSDDLGLVRLAGPDGTAEDRWTTFPLIRHGKARIMRLRGYGNAINPYVAAEVIRAYLDTRA